MLLYTDTGISLQLKNDKFTYHDLSVKFHFQTGWALFLLSFKLKLHLTTKPPNSSCDHSKQQTWKFALLDKLAIINVI